MATMLNLVAAVVLAGIAAPSAQEPLPPPPPANPRAGVRVDTVVATVNDEVIMLSELRTLVAGRIRAAEAERGQALTSQEQGVLFQRELGKLIEKHTMAQAAKTFGVASPEMIEELFRDELRRDEQEQVRNLGTWQEFSRELQRQGRTWQAYEREQRVEKMNAFTEEFAIRMRLQKQSNLFLTPSMLREAYNQEVGRFVRGSRALVALLVFRGDDAKAKAEQAAAIWRKEDITSRDLATRFPDATPLDELDAGSLVADLPLAKFAFAGPINAVSDPIEFSGAYQVAKVTAFVAARNGRFEDADVQIELRDLCMARVVDELRRQALVRASLRTEVSLVQAARR